MHADIQKVLASCARQWALDRLQLASFCTVAEEEETRSRKSLTYSPPLPASPGIYVGYLNRHKRPFYIGEATNLKRRVKYHFSKAISAVRDSTMQKKLRKLGYSGHAHKIVRFKFFEVWFGRKEIEVILKAEFKIDEC
jgi:hypothetical protein